MRVALISDVHANLIALEAVLADAKRVGYDQLVCLGDVAALGPQPNETLDRLRALGCPTVQGNHDPFVPEPPALEELERWSEEVLSADHLAYLRGLPAELEFDLGPAGALLCVHGSPRSYDEQVLAETPEAELGAMLSGREFAVMACGHTHVQLLRRHGSQTVLNVGSVGMPFERAFQRGDPTPRVLPWAEYAIVSGEGGRISVDLRQVPYDFEAYAVTVRASGMPYQDWWLEQWTAP